MSGSCHSINRTPNIYKSGEGGTSGPIVVDSDFSIETLPVATAEGSYTCTGANNQGSNNGTLRTVSISFQCRRLGCFPLQGLGNTGFFMLLYDENKNPVARTGEFTIGSFGPLYMPITHVWDPDNGVWIPASDGVMLQGEEAYYFSIYCPQTSSGARFMGIDAGTTFGPQPWISWTVDNLGLLPGVPPHDLVIGYESQIRYLMYGAA